MTAPSPLLPFVQKYVEDDPAAAARKLEAIDEEEASAVALALPPALLARVVPHLQVGYAATLLKDAEPDVFKEVTRKLDTKRAATIYMRLPKDAQEAFLPVLNRKLKIQLHDLLNYPDDSVGRMMTTEWLAVRKNLKVSDTIARIRALIRKGVPSSYIYVVEEQDHLVGVINMRDLLVSSPDEPVENVMRTDLFKIHCFTDVSDAAAELSKRRYFAAPVVDSEDRLLGVVKAEQLIHGVQDEVAQDIQTMFGAGSDERVFSPMTFSLRKRLPWLHVNLATAFLAAGVVAMFQGVIEKITILAVFLPVVAGQGGNAGAQSLAIVMRGLVMREIPHDKHVRLILKEGGLGIITGVVTGLVTALVAYMWQGSPALGVVIGLGMSVNLFFAGLAGASIPILMRALGLDPAQCSSIILTTVTDVIGFFAFLGFAVLFQNHLIP